MNHSGIPMRRSVVLKTCCGVAGLIMGAVLPVVILWVLAQIVSWAHDDPFAGGVLSFLAIPAIPIGAVVGAIIGFANASRFESHE